MSAQIVPSNIENNEIYVRAMSEDRVTRNAAYRELQTLLVRLLRARVARGGYRLREDQIDDILQELMLSAFQKDLPRFDPTRGTLVGFLSRRVHWTLIDYFRSAPSEVDLDAVSEYVESPSASPEQALLSAEDCRLRTEVVAKVQTTVKSVRDKKVRRALWYHDIVGESMKTVSSRFGVHSTTVGRARQRGLSILKVSLASCAWAASMPMSF